MSIDGPQAERFLTKCEVAQLCRVEIRTVDRWVAAGKITWYRTPGGRLLFRERDVLMAADRAGTPRSEWPVMQRAIRR
jgi:excisionase family DNA binding protein